MLAHLWELVLEILMVDQVDLLGLELLETLKGKVLWGKQMVVVMVKM